MVVEVEVVVPVVVEDVVEGCVVVVVVPVVVEEVVEEPVVVEEVVEGPIRKDELQGYCRMISYTRCLNFNHVEENDISLGCWLTWGCGGGSGCSSGG